jgi:hypothetical protein
MDALEAVEEGAVALVLDGQYTKARLLEMLDETITRAESEALDGQD